MDAFTADDLGMAPGAEHPLIEPVYPVYRDPRLKGLIKLRRGALRKGAPVPISGAEAARRALAQQVWDIAKHFVEQAFAHAGRELAPNDPAFAVAAERYFRRLSTHQMPDLEALAEAIPTPVAINPCMHEAVGNPVSALTASGAAPTSAARQKRAPNPRGDCPAVRRRTSRFSMFESRSRLRATRI